MTPHAMLQPERADQHGADVVAAGLGDAQRTGERQHHDQAEQHFGDALARVEHALGVVSFSGHQRVVAGCRAGMAIGRH